jgi:hypothetical protein
MAEQFWNVTLPPGEKVAVSLDNTAIHVTQAVVQDDRVGHHVRVLMTVRDGASLPLCFLGVGKGSTSGLRAQEALDVSFFPADRKVTFWTEGAAGPVHLLGARAIDDDDMELLSNQMEAAGGRPPLGADGDDGEVTGEDNSSSDDDDNDDDNDDGRAAQGSSAGKDDGDDDDDDDDNGSDSGSDSDNVGGEAGGAKQSGDKAAAERGDDDNDDDDDDDDDDDEDEDDSEKEQTKPGKPSNKVKGSKGTAGVAAAAAAAEAPARSSGQQKRKASDALAAPTQSGSSSSTGAGGGAGSSASASGAALKAARREERDVGIKTLTPGKGAVLDPNKRASVSYTVMRKADRVVVDEAKQHSLVLARDSPKLLKGIAKGIVGMRVGETRQLVRACCCLCRPCKEGVCECITW